jgi:hypothetical protein
MILSCSFPAFAVFVLITTARIHTEIAKITKIYPVLNFNRSTQVFGYGVLQDPIPLRAPTPERSDHGKGEEERG